MDDIGEPELDDTGARLAARIRAEREARGWSLADLAAPAGTDMALAPGDMAQSIRQRCFPNIGNGPDGGTAGPNYDQFHPIINPSCEGTNHQDIKGIQKVVFLGDSITVGTPPTLSNDYYRSKLAAQLAKQYGLKAPDPLAWNTVNVINGVGLNKTSGDFWDCAKWGAQTRDLQMTMQQQIANCFPMLPEPKKTLVVLTMGGNDLNSIAKDGLNGTPPAQLLTRVDQSVANVRAAIKTLQDPQKFPSGVFIVFANVYEFTDGTGDLLSCPSAQAAGYDKPWPDGAPVSVYLNEQLMKVAVETQTDMLFLFEEFCGHGFKRNDPNGPCYRGPNTPLWFDPITCIHPNTEGHGNLAKFFFDVITQ